MTSNQKISSAKFQAIKHTVFALKLAQIKVTHLEAVLTPQVSNKSDSEILSLLTTSLIIENPALSSSTLQHLLKQILEDAYYVEFNKVIRTEELEQCKARLKRLHMTANKNLVTDAKHLTELLH